MEEQTGQETSSNLIFDRVVAQIEKNKKLREEGKHIVIPFPFKRFTEEIPGIQQGVYYLISANQKTGKTQITDTLFMYNAVNFVLTQKTNIKLKIFDFNLEMKKEGKIKQAILYRQYITRNIRYNQRELDSIYSYKILPSDMVEFIKQDREWFEKFESIVEFIDDIRNAYGIYRYLRNFFESNGKYHYKTVKITEDDGTVKDIETIDRYEPNDPDLFVIIIVDNINLLTPEKGQTIYEAINKFSSHYMVRVRNRWNGIPVVIQQQSLSKESNDSIKLDRTEPTADGLADNKVTSKDCDVLITLYSPFRNKIKSYMNYKIDRLKDSFRRLSVEFDRNGNACDTALYFDGAVNFFKELPKPEDISESLYGQLENRQIKVK